MGWKTNLAREIQSGYARGTLERKDERPPYTRVESRGRDLVAELDQQQGARKVASRRDTRHALMFGPSSNKGERPRAQAAEARGRRWKR